MSTGHGHRLFYHLLRLSRAAIAGLVFSACDGFQQVATVNTPKLHN
jgi:hypothetical protein